MAFRPNTNTPTGKAVLALSVLGGILFLIGLRLAFITRIYLDTGRTTHPDLGAGIVLGLVGLGLLLGSSAVGRRSS